MSFLQHLPPLSLWAATRKKSFQSSVKTIDLARPINPKAMSEMLPSDKLAIIDSFPLPLCQPIRNHSATIFKGLADIGYYASKYLWFYGFKVHMLVTLSGYILNYVVTPTSVHDIKVGYELL